MMAKNCYSRSVGTAGEHKPSPHTKSILVFLPAKRLFWPQLRPDPAFCPIAGVDLRLGLLSTEHVFQIIPDVWQGNCQSCL